MLTLVISDLVASGITDVQEIRKLLQHYVQHTISVKLNLTPSLTDRAFYPMPCDIRNHISKAKKAVELSKLDQENLSLKIEDWKKSSPSTNHFFRPYVMENNIKNDQDKRQLTSISNSTTEINSRNQDTDCFQGFSDECSQTFLWIHQENWQRDLLVKFGYTITLINATYL